MWRNRIQCVIGIVVLALLLPPAASADVVIKQKTTSTMMGGMIQMNGHMTTYISGEKQKTDSEMKSDMPMAAGAGMKSSNIVRLDKDLIWDVDHAQKSYSELTFAQMRAIMGSQQGIGKPGQSGAPVPGDMEIGKPEFRVKRTGGKEKIMGYNCEEVILEVITRTRDKKTGDTGSFTLHSRMWVTKEWSGCKEYEAFARKSADKMGFGMGSEAGSSLAMMGLDAKDLMEKMAEIGGFPMRQKMTMTVSGNLGGQAGGEMAEQQEAMKKAAEMMKGMKGMEGMFGEGTEKESKKASATEPAAVFEMTTEVESVSTEGIDSKEFEIPAGYKKIAELR